MNSIEFQFQINNEGIIKIPKKYLKSIPCNLKMKAILILPENDSVENNTIKLNRKRLSGVEIRKLPKPVRAEYLREISKEAVISYNKNKQFLEDSIFE